MKLRFIRCDEFHFFPQTVQSTYLYHGKDGTELLLGSFLWGGEVHYIFVILNGVYTALRRDLGLQKYLPIPIQNYIGRNSIQRRLKAYRCVHAVKRQYLRTLTEIK